MTLLIHSYDYNIDDLMTRIEYCAAENFDAIEQLLSAIARLGGTYSDADEDAGPGIGVGLNRFRIDGEEVTVYCDAWVVDLVGTDRTVERILVALREELSRGNP